MRYSILLFFFLGTYFSTCAAVYTVNVTSSSSMDYTFSGDFSGADPTININLGDSIVFVVNTPAHPFWIKTIQGPGTGDAVSVTNNGTTSGTITWAPATAGTFFYNCQLHGMMTGSIIVSSGTTSVMATMQNPINIYPNPFREKVSISECVGCEVKIFNLIGKLESTQIVQSSQAILSTDHLSAGVYIYQILNGTEKSAGKLVKK